MTLVRTCCCNPQEPIVCCGEWPTYCATPVGLGYWFYSIHRSLIHHGSSITLAGLTPVALSASFVGSTTAVDPETLQNECSFPDPIDQYPYPVLMPGFAQTPIRPWNYSVPVFRGTSAVAGDYEIVWPMLQKCCIGGSYDQLVVGFEVRGSDLIGKIVAQLGTSPNNLTGAYNGTGRHWYSLPNGNFRFFADPGLWERDGLGAGLPSFSPFRLGHESGPTIIEHTGAVPFQFTHTNWCLENGFDNPCRCNFSFPEDPQCCEFYTASIYLRVANDGCATHEISTSCIMRRTPSPCPQGSPIDVVGIKNSLTRFPATVPNGTYTVDKINANGCCVDYLPPNPPSTGFDVPFVSVAAIGCDLNPEDYPCLGCDLLPQTKFDALFCITAGYTLDADVPFGDPCAARYVNANTWYIGVYLRNNGDGCCIDGYRDRGAYFLNNVNGNCVWEPVLDFNITFDCED